MANSLTENTTLESFSLQGNTLTAQSGQAFLTLMHTNKKLSKLDLTKNLIPLRFINEINKKCEANNDKTDDKLMPRLVNEYNRQLAVQKQPEDYQKVQKELEHLKRFEKTDQKRCEGIKADFWELYHDYKR